MYDCLNDMFLQNELTLPWRCLDQVFPNVGHSLCFEELGLLESTYMLSQQFILF